MFNLLIHLQTSVSPHFASLRKQFCFRKGLNVSRPSRARLCGPATTHRSLPMAGTRSSSAGTTEGGLGRESGCPAGVRDRTRNLDGVLLRYLPPQWPARQAGEQVGRTCLPVTPPRLIAPRYTQTHKSRSQHTIRVLIEAGTQAF
jgi:hypothetical protein